MRHNFARSMEDGKQDYLHRTYAFGTSQRAEIVHHVCLNTCSHAVNFLYQDQNTPDIYHHFQMFTPAHLGTYGMLAAEGDAHFAVSPSFNRCSYKSYHLYKATCTLQMVQSRTTTCYKPVQMLQMPQSPTWNKQDRVEIHYHVCI